MVQVRRMRCLKGHTRLTFLGSVLPQVLDKPQGVHFLCDQGGMCTQQVLNQSRRNEWGSSPRMGSG